MFIARGVGIAPAARNELETKLLVGGVIWAFLGIIFEIVTETVAWERWEGTIEYTFMAPVSRPVHLIGMGVYAVIYGLVRAALVFFAVVVFIGIHLPHANYGAAIALLAIASISFIGVGMMTAVLPLVSPEKGTQLGFVAQGLMLVVSGVYYPVSVLPDWMQWVAKISPATYALRGNREQILNGAGLAWADVWPLLVIGAFSIPIGLAVFKVGERYAKKHGKLKRSGIDDVRRDAIRCSRDRGASGRRSTSSFRSPPAVRSSSRVGSGRIAMPLAERGVRVHGIDISPDVLEQLHGKPGGERVTTTLGDYTTTTVDGSFSLVYLVWNSLSNVTTQDGQVAAFANAAAHLEPGGSFVVEMFVPQLRRLPPGQDFVPFDVTPEHLGFDEYDVLTQRLVSHHYWPDARQARLGRVPVRLAVGARPDGPARRDEAP